MTGTVPASSFKGRLIRFRYAFCSAWSEGLKRTAHSTFYPSLRRIASTGNLLKGFIFTTLPAISLFKWT